MGLFSGEDHFSFPLSPSVTMKAGPQGGEANSGSSPLGLVSVVHDVFSDRDLPSISGGN